MIQTKSADSVHTGILQVWQDTYPSWLLGWDLGTKLGKKGNHNKCVPLYVQVHMYYSLQNNEKLYHYHSDIHTVLKHLIILCKNLCTMSY